MKYFLFILQEVDFIHWRYSLPKRLEILFNPIPYPRIDMDSKRKLQNIDQGADFEALKSVILEKMPTVNRESVITTYEILFTEREEDTPRSFPRLHALVRVRCEGNYIDEWPSVQGLYEVKLTGYIKITHVTIKKSSPGEAQQFTIDPLPCIRDLYMETAAASA